MDCKARHGFNGNTVKLQCLNTISVANRQVCNLVLCGNEMFYGGLDLCPLRGFSNEWDQHRSMPVFQETTFTADLFVFFFSLVWVPPRPPL